LRLPVAPTGVVASLGSAWRRRLRWYPGDWIWVALALLAIAALGAGLAILASREENARQTLVATIAPAAAASPAQRTRSRGAPRRRQEPAATAPRGNTARAAERASGPPRLTAWPTARGGWTVVLRSDVNRETARREARQALQAGFRDVGVLDSSDYPSLHPGYHVVFSGVYKTQAAAEAALAAARSRGYGRAYVRQVSP
jgi:hypothetical protein